MDGTATAEALRARIRSVGQRIAVARRRCRAHAAVTSIHELTPRELFVIRHLLYHEDFELDAAVKWLHDQFSTRTTRRLWPRLPGP
eukprot:7197480-Prorocentrum_lima.AAC.1